MAKGAQGKVLVVEDDEGMREAIETLLDAAGIESACYPSAEALLAGSAVEDALCIISDIKLPAMSGLDLLTELRARRQSPPVIVISAHDSASVRADAARHGAAAYLAKPFLGTALLAAIDDVTNSARTP
jgi:FixJ family two-component response regulator